MVGLQAVIAGKPAPTGFWVHLQNQVGWQAVFAGKPAPTGFWVHLQNQVGWQAVFAGKPRSYRGFVYICKISAAGKPQCWSGNCRSELAREGLKSAAFNQ